MTECSNPKPATDASLPKMLSAKGCSGTQPHRNRTFIPRATQLPPNPYEQVDTKRRGRRPVSRSQWYNEGESSKRRSPAHPHPSDNIFESGISRRKTNKSTDEPTPLPVLPTPIPCICVEICKQNEKTTTPCLSLLLLIPM